MKARALVLTAGVCCLLFSACLTGFCQSARAPSALDRPASAEARLTSAPAVSLSSPTTSGQEWRLSGAWPDPTASDAILSDFAEVQDRFNELVLRRTLDRLRQYKRACRTPAEAKPWEERIRQIDRCDLAWLGAATRDCLNRLHDAGLDLAESQYLLYVDRNPRRQLALVGFYDARTGRVLPVGVDLISSGNIAKSGDYYVTPTGVFENLVENFGYRAQGTPNKDGWLGLGAKGSRVWDFGYAKSQRMYQGAPTLSEMRLLIHSTDPAKGEKRLGRMDSKGCVRVSAGLNAFLDVHSILDKNYEDWIKGRGASWLLLKDRAPVRYPGRYMVIGDTSPDAATASR